MKGEILFLLDMMPVNTKTGTYWYFLSSFGRYRSRDRACTVHGASM